MATSPTFAVTPRIGIARVTVTGTDLVAATTGVVSVLLAGTSGTRIDRVIINQNGVSGTAEAAAVVRLWVHDGTTNYLWKQVVTTGATPSATTAGYTIEFPTPNLVLPTLYSLKATVTNATTSGQDMTVIAFGADL